MIRRARATALLLGGAAIGAVRVPGGAQTAATLRIATAPIENAAEASYAKSLGFFGQAGIDVDIVPTQGGAVTATTVASNAADIGFGTIDVLAAAHQKNIPLVVIAPAAEYRAPLTAGISALVVPGNSAVRTARDLNGKIVAAASLHSLAQTAPQCWIDKNGGDSSTVKFVEVPFPAMPAALDAGRIDAAFVTEPFIAEAKQHGRVLADCFAAISSHFIVGAWFATLEWATDHRDVVNRFAAVMRRTADWANRNQSQSAALLAAFTKADPNVIASTVRAHYGTELTPALMQPLIEVSAKYNGFTAFPAQDLIFH